MALIPVRPLYSASATATNGSDIIQVTGNVDCSFMTSGSIVSIGTRQLVDAVSGTAPDLSGNSTIKLRRPWADPNTTAPLLAFMSREGLADAVNRLRQIIDASEGTLQGAFSNMGDWDASSGNFPPAPGEGLGSQMYRVSVAGTMGGRAYRVGEPLYYDQFTSQWRSFFELASAFSTGLLAGANAAAWRTALAVISSSGDQYINGRLAIGTSSSLQGKLTLTEDTDANNYFWGRHNFNGANSYTGYVLNAFGNSWAIRMGSFAANANALEIVQDVGGSNLRRLVVDTSGKLLSPNGSAFVGIVSNSGLGAIIQRGSNANGEFVRFADGTQICLMYPDFWVVIGGGTPTTPFNTNNVVPFPSTFTGKRPSISFAYIGRQAYENNVAKLHSLTLSEVQISVELNTTVSAPEYSIIAIGRWY